MSTEHDQHDDALDKVLAALRDAVPPEGMEARITHRLQQHAAATPAAPLRWRDVFANSAITSAWWRGAIAGAAAVMLAAGLLLFTNHLLQTRPDRGPTERNDAANRNLAPAALPVGTSPNGAPASETRARPCAHPTMLRTASVAQTHTTMTLLADTYAESAAPSRPAPELPLTAQERALIRLAQTSPKQLETLDPEEYANLEAQSALKFAKFFASPAPLSSADGNAETNSIETRYANSGNSKPDSAASSDEKPENEEAHPSPTKEEE